MASSTSVALVFMFARIHASEINSRILGDIFNIIHFYMTLGISIHKQ